MLKPNPRLLPPPSQNKTLTEEEIGEMKDKAYYSRPDAYENLKSTDERKQSNPTPEKGKPVEMVAPEKQTPKLEN
jgi:hypothetical protein